MFSEAVDEKIAAMHRGLDIWALSHLKCDRMQLHAANRDWQDERMRQKSLTY